MNFDIVFISYDEENADENYEHLLNYYPYAKRVHGVDGIREAHKQAAIISTTDFFFTIDGDNKILLDSDLTPPDTLNQNTVYVWRCKNAVNDLVYGFGAIKLWHKNIFTKDLNSYTDHAMSATKNYQVINKIASITHFNSSAFSAWRSGFREAVKLSNNIHNNIDQYSANRLNIWKTVGMEKPFGDWCIRGAKMGEDYFLKYNSMDIINKFNDLKKIFDKNNY